MSEQNKEPVLSVDELARILFEEVNWPTYIDAWDKGRLRVSHEALRQQLVETEIQRDNYKALYETALYCIKKATP